MCHKTLEAVFIESHIKEYDNITEKLMSKTATDFGKANINPLLLGAGVVGYSIHFQHELKTTFGAGPIADSLSLRTIGDFTGGAWALSWHF